MSDHTPRDRLDETEAAEAEYPQLPLVVRLVVRPGFAKRTGRTQR